MRPLYTLLTVLAFVFTSCNKDLSYEGGYIPPVEPPVVEPPVVEPPVLSDFDHFKQLILDFDFQLRDFYSNIPIDFIEDDNQNLSETNLWHYVPDYLKDDINSFDEAGIATINQFSIKKPGIDEDIFTRTYSIEEIGNNVFITFLDADYTALQYKVSEIGSDYFILSIEWSQGATLHSRFEKADE